MFIQVDLPMSSMIPSWKLSHLSVLYAVKAMGQSRGQALGPDSCSRTTEASIPWGYRGWPATAR
jgi:hypothetical protein